ncbi:MAG: aminotransferase class V-fold PLP-dependent enzyme [Caldilineaceae bacterium]
MAEKSFFEALGLRRVVNAAGKLTMLGASTQSTGVRAAMAEGAQNFVDLGELMAVADRKIAEATGAEGGFITSCSAAGIAIATAAAITRGDLARTEALPFITTPPNEIILQAGHKIHFGAALTQMVRLGGAQIVEIGTVNRTLPHQLSQAICERSAAVLFVVSHHAYQGGAISLSEVIRIAHSRNVPVIVDAAAEVDLHKYIASGADLVIYSGHKALNSPTAGLIAGRRDLIDACHQQNQGIGRSMKIGKENIIGTLAALAEYTNAAASDETSNDATRTVALLKTLATIPGLHAEAVPDVTRPSIVRVRLHIDKATAKLDARTLVTRLEAHSPSIRTRNHALEQGIVEIDFRPLAPGEELIVGEAIQFYLG